MHPPPSSDTQSDPNLLDPSTQDAESSSDAPHTDIDSDLEFQFPPRPNRSPVQSRPAFSSPRTHYPGNIPPRLSSKPKSGYDDEKYFQAYWAHIRNQRRSDPLSLPLVPYTDADYGIMDEKNQYSLPPQNARAYSHSRRPLIDFIQNEWQHTIGSTGPSPTARSFPTWNQVLTAPRFRRYAVVFLVGTLCWVNWVLWAGELWREHELLRDAVKGKARPGTGFFGANMRPTFQDMIQLKTIDESLVPKKGGNGRLIVVGDVHGCHDELVALLTEVEYNVHNDHLILVGDLVSKGPSSPAVVKLAMSMHASCVRGNHEDRVLLAHRDLNSHSLSVRSSSSSKKNNVQISPAPPSPGPYAAGAPAPPEKNLDTDRFEHGDAVDRELARSLSRKELEYLAACPLILKLGRLNGMGAVQIVHAGLVPGLDLENQDPISVMSMRTMDLETHVPSSRSGGIPWNKLWDKYQSYLPKSARSTVIYGHDSRRGLQLTRYTKGLDTGCVKGGKLTALVIDGHGANERVRSVPCKDYRSASVQQREKLGDMGQS